MIIDFHTHLFPDEVRNAREHFVSDGAFKALYADRRARLVSPAELLASMDECGVNVSVAMGFSWESADLCRMHNRYFSGLRAETGGRIIAFGSVPSCCPEAIDEAAAEIRETGLLGIGEVALYTTDTHEARILYLETLLERAGKYALPVCLHVNEPVGHEYPGKYAHDFPSLCRMLGGWNGAPVILSHWGGGMLFYELMPEVQRSLSNVYYDTAASPFLYRDDVYRVALDILGPDKILFGSDYPLLSPARYLAGINSIADSGARSRVMGLNAAAILGLAEKIH